MTGIQRTQNPSEINRPACISGNVPTVENGSNLPPTRRGTAPQRINNMPTWNANGRGSIDVDPLTVNKNGTQSDFQPRSYDMQNPSNDPA
jgi:hypothetical protein